MNKRLKAHEDRRAALLKNSDAILEAVVDRDLTEEETAKLDANKLEIAKADRLIEYERELSGYNRPLCPDGIETHGLDITAVRPAWEDDPKKGFKTHSDFLTEVIAAGRGRPVDARLQFLATAGSDEAGTYSNPYGGYLIPEGFAPGVLSMSPEADPIGSRVTQVPMAFPTLSFNARVDKDHSTSVSGGLVVTRRAETQTQTASRTQYEQVKLEVHNLFGLSYASEEILERSPVSFAAILEAGFRDQFTSHLINERLNGTGVGEMEGVMTSPALVTVEEEAGQDADSIVYENLVKMRSRCWGYGSAIWLANHDCLPNLMSIVFPGTLGGFPVWQTSAREKEPDVLFGRPVILTEYSKTIGDLGDIILVNWSQYLEGTYKPLRSAESIHVRFINHERTFKFWIENDGRCWWRSALTPKNSTKTLSPIVCLSAR